MKELGEVEHILGIRIKKDMQQYTLHLSQEKYIENVLDTFNVDDAKLLEWHYNHMLNFPRMIVPKMMMQPIT